MAMTSEELIVQIARDVGLCKGNIEGLESRVSEFHRAMTEKMLGVEGCLKDLPVIKVQVTNHLVHHDQFSKFFWFPVGVAIFLGFCGLMLRVFFHVF